MTPGENIPVQADLEKATQMSPGARPGADGVFDTEDDDMGPPIGPEGVQLRRDAATWADRHPGKPLPPHLRVDNYGRGYGDGRAPENFNEGPGQGPNSAPAEEAPAEEAPAEEAPAEEQQPAPVEQTAPAGIPGDADGDGKVTVNEVEALIKTPQAFSAALDSEHAPGVIKGLVDGATVPQKFMLNGMIKSDDFRLLAQKGIRDPATQKKVGRLLKQLYPNGI
jgi:hypothetical protein